MRKRRGFTLVELLVVVAIIALLLSILLPSLETAREQARSVVCGTRLHDVFAGATTYGNQYEDWMPGAPGTTGVELRAVEDEFDGEALDTPGTVTQIWDWAAPVARYGLGYRGMPKDRAERMAQLREGLFLCPSNNYLVESYPQNRDGWPAVMRMNSYSTTREFMYFGRQASDAIVDTQIFLPSFFDVYTPSGYVPRFASVEKPSSKVMMHEGSRYIDAGTNIQDFDINHNGGYGGSFSDAGASSSYSRGFANPAALDPNAPPAESASNDPKWDRTSYRHRKEGKHATQVLYFDGHAEVLSKLEAITGIDLWWPSGTLLGFSGDRVGELMDGPSTGQHAKPRANKVAVEREETTIRYRYAGEDREGFEEFEGKPIF